MIKTTLITALGGLIAAASIAVAAPAVATGYGQGGAAGSASGATSESGGARTTATRNAGRPAPTPGVRAAAAVGAPAPEGNVQLKALADAIRSGEINSTRPIAGLDDPSGDPLPAPVIPDDISFALPGEVG